MESANKAFMLLEQYELQPQFLREKDFEFFISGTLSMNFSKVPVLDNIKANKEYLEVGSQFTKVLAFVDLENIELPNEIEPYSVLGGSGSASETVVDNFTFLNELEDCNTVIYNQVIAIPNQSKQLRELEKKKRKHEGATQNSPSNMIVANEIDDLITSIARHGFLIVDAHYSITFSTNTIEHMERVQSVIENKLFTKGIVVSKSAFNQIELFRGTMPGNVTELRDYDFFTTTDEAALCFFFNESYPLDEESNISLRFTDRQGVPLKVDLSDIPMSTGRINNRNKFVLGPSGSGKSFLMNNIVEQYLNFNYDVVIVDTGDSYSGTSSYKNGRYIKYTEEKPITMNPFAIEKGDLNIEKIQFLSSLIFLIWQGPDAEMSKVHETVIRNAILSYYDQYFNKGKSWYEHLNNDELLMFLQKFNIHEDEIYSTIEHPFYEKNYYEILGLTSNASTAQIKTIGRKLIRQYHPDANVNNPEYDKENYYLIYDAYSTLVKDDKRKEYDKSLKLSVVTQNSEDFEERKKDNTDYFRIEIIKRIKGIEGQMVVNELSFNSFYDYCDVFFPFYLKNRKHPINENEFNLRTFRAVLKDFYKGGVYGEILNKPADNSLFDETLIVFEIDNIKDDPTLFPIITLIIMDTFLQKMRFRRGRRKALIIEEAWKAIASKLMGGYIVYLYKTVRKFLGEAIVVTQELNDIIGNEIVKDSIINNSDTIILLDQTKFKDNFDEIASLLSLNQVEQNKIFTINNLNNKAGRGKFKEFYIKRGSTGEVYGNEVSLEQYLTYTTEKPEKEAIEYYLDKYGTYDSALQYFINDLKILEDSLLNLVSIINMYQAPLDSELLEYYQHLKNDDRVDNPIVYLQNRIKEEDTNLQSLVQNKNQWYEEV